MSLDPDHAQSLTYLGDIAMKQNRTDEALSLLRRAVRKRNDLRVAFLDLGVLLIQNQQYQEAVSTLQRAVTLDPAAPDAHYQLGRAYRAMGKTQASQQEFDKARQLHEKADEGLVRKMSPAPPALPQ